MKTHAGIPHQNMALDDALLFYFQCNTGETGVTWWDQSVHERSASQETAANQPTALSGGGLSFDDSNDEANASMMDFETLEVTANTNFLMFIVWNPEATSSSAYLSNTTAEVFQQTSGNTTLFKTGSGAKNTAMTHGNIGGTGGDTNIFAIDTGEKSVFMLERTNGATGTIKIYKNGKVCDGHNNAGTVNASEFSLQNLGSKNDASNWFSGTMYDVGFISEASISSAVPSSDKRRQMIGDYLMCKHGIERLGND